MLDTIKYRLYTLLRATEKYTKTDMVYLFRGNFWLMFSRILSVGSGLFLTTAFANLFPPTSYGTYKYVLAIAGFVGAFSLGGLGGAVTRAVAQGKAHVVPGVARIAFLWSVPASLAALIGALYYMLNGNMPLGLGFLFIAGTNSFFSVFVFSKSIPLGKQDFRGLSLVSIPSAIIPIILLIVTVMLTDNVITVLAVYFASNLVTGFSSYKWFLYKYGITKGNNEGVAETVQYGKHLSVMGAFSQMVSPLDIVLLWHFAGPIPVATYSLALAPIRELRNFSENIYPLVFPKYVTKTIDEMKRTASLRAQQLFIVSAFIAIAYIALAPLLFKLIFPKYLSSVFASQILAAGLLLQPKGLVEIMLYAQGNTSTRYVSTSVTQVAKVLAFIILIPPFGLMGAVLGTIIADAASATILYWAYKVIR